MSYFNTAIKRTKPSAPLLYFLTYHQHLIRKEQPLVLDYGCGYGKDVEYLLQQDRFKFRAFGMDPMLSHNYSKDRTIYHNVGMSDWNRYKYDLIFMTYVLNVINSHEERIKVFKKAWKYLSPGGILVVTCRTIKEIEREAIKNSWAIHGDGYFTNSLSFQTGFDNIRLASYDSLIEDLSVETYCTNGKFAMGIYRKEIR